jgi:hypothetical protein
VEVENATPLGVPQALVHGLADAVVPPSMSEDYVRKAVPLDDVGHREVIDSSGPARREAARQFETIFG